MLKIRYNARVKRPPLRSFIPCVFAFTVLLLPIAAHAQSPFDTGFTALQTLFTGTVA